MPLKIRFLFCFIIFIVTILQSCAFPEYEWKPYNGTIPEDAVEGNEYGPLEPVYIGQAVVEGVGTIVAPIYSNKSFVEVPLNGKVLRVDSSINILCGDSQPVEWIRANSENLHVVLIAQNFVIGGKIDNQGYLHVGRISYENEIKIGPIESYNLDDARLSFVHEGKVLNTPTYEVLQYRRPPPPPHRGRHPKHHHGPPRRHK